MPTKEASGETVRGAAVLHALDRLWRRGRDLASRGIPESLDPLRQAGAVANTLFAVACASGVLLLFWYVPTVGDAHASVAGLAGERSLGGLVRSVHRYSSDACILFVLLHAVDIFLARRFTGGRWLSWVSGILLLIGIWAVGWTGAWLVWDEPARQVATGTARMIDALPVFTDPLSRSFLTDDGVNSLLFFLVFFLHVLLPLALVGALWIHVARIARARVFTGRFLTGWIVLTLGVASLVVPAGIGEPARMGAIPDGFPMDAWYLAPLLLTERFSGGALWGVFLVGTCLLVAVPWMLRRRRVTVAQVDVSRCNACAQCFADCPYEAIRMVPRTDAHHRWEAQAEVTADRCVGCGICAGSCDSVGIDLPNFGTQEQRRLIDGWIDEDREAGRTPRLVLASEHSAGAALRPDARGRSALAPDWRVLEVPCAGWVHPVTVERALKRGASEVVIVAAAPGECSYREGSKWLQERLAGQREPSLRTDRVEARRLRVLELGLGDGAALRRALQGHAMDRTRRRTWTAVRGGVLAAVLAAFVVALSHVPHVSAGAGTAALVVSFKHPGQVALKCRELSDAEIAALPVHMRREEECERRRAPVRMEVTVDGDVLLDRTVEPAGLWGDGPSIAAEELALPPGSHAVRVRLADTHEGEWTHVTERHASLLAGHRTVVTFDRDDGFQWHEPDADEGQSARGEDS